MLSVWRSLDLGDVAAARASLEELIPELVQAYGSVASVLAADFYDELRSQAATASAFEALLADPANSDQAAAVARWAIAKGLSDEALRKLSGGVQRLIRQPVRQTIAESVQADPDRPRWARIPRGDQTCAFCLVLASRGPTYRTAAAAGEDDPNKFHDWCDCEPVMFWRGDPLPEDYDPGALFDKYDTAANQVGGPRSNFKAILAQLRINEGIA